MENTRGSEWRKWDLHVHTASSYDYQYNNGDADDKLVEALKQQNIKVVAISDHFVISKERLESLRSKTSDIVFFPAVELRTDKGDTNIHLILIFDDQSNLQDLVEDFNAFKRNYGKNIDSNDRIYWDFNDIINFAKNHDAIISIHAGRKSNGVDDRITNALEHNQAVKEEFAENVDIFEMEQERDLDDYRTHVFPTIGIKPMVICSDNHNPNEYKCSLWIKADPTFEGLKQILYEPEERVKIQQNKPEDKKGYQVIDSVSLQEDGFWDDIIYLNENLNTIIGGRSTGKSTLLKSIARMIDKNSSLDDDTEFIDDHLKGVSIRWKDGLDGVSRYIQFLPQNYMHKIAKNANRELDELIERIIDNRDENMCLMTYKEINREIEKTLNKNILEAFQLQTELTNLQTQLKEKGDKKGVEIEIERLKQKNRELSENANITEEELKQYQECLQGIDITQHAIEQANKDIQLLESLKNKTIFNDEYTYGFDNMSDSLKEDVSNSFKDLKKQATERWIKDLDSFITKIKDECEKFLKTKMQYETSEIFKKGKVYYDNNKELSDIQSKLKEENERLKSITEIEKKVKNTVDREKKMVETIVSKHLEYKDNAQKLKDQLKTTHDDVEISTKIECKSEDIYKFLEQRCNLRGNDRQSYISSVYKDYETTTNDVVTTFVEKALRNDIEFKNYNTSQNVLTEFLTKNWYEYSFELTYQKDNFNEMSPGKKAFVILKLLLEFDTRECPILIDQPEDSLDNRAIYNELVQYIKNKKKQRQIILVTHNPNVVIGADSENVIIANQQGSNSNNKNGIRFQYVNGSLENTQAKDKSNSVVLESQGIREHVCEILEGGQEAFEKREKKYGF